jgi:diguanylate cyclase (GGDEF)-like protein
MIDGLTGLWNRAHFDQRMHEEVAAAARYDRPMSLIMMDVDKFKNLNDNHGHPFGDEVLQAVGDVLQDSARTSDWPCRYGGEEFGLILRETDLEGAVVMADRVREEIESLQPRNKAQLVPVTSSFGVVSSTQCMNPCDLSSKWMIESADRALYAAKDGGRNCVRTAEQR